MEDGLFCIAKNIKVLQVSIFCPLGRMLDMHIVYFESFKNSVVQVLNQNKLSLCLYRKELLHVVNQNL